MEIKLQDGDVVVIGDIRYRVRAMYGAEPSLEKAYF